MTRYAVSQAALAFILAAVGTLKAIRVVVDAIDDAVSLPAGGR